MSNFRTNVLEVIYFFSCNLCKLSLAVQPFIYTRSRTRLLCPSRDILNLTDVRTLEPSVLQVEKFDNSSTLSSIPFNSRAATWRAFQREGLCRRQPETQT